MLVIWLNAALSILLAGPSTAPPSRAERAAIEGRLQANTQPSSAREWQALGAGVDEVLIAIAEDVKVDLKVRARAVSALGTVPTPAGSAFLERLIKQKASSNDERDKLMLRKAAVALGWTGATGAAARLGPLLQHSDPDVRLDAAIGLGLTRSDEAADFLRKRFDVETIPKVRSQIGRQLNLIEGAATAARWPQPSKP